jgi:maltooligosyltrehalose trehalohydrolase
MLINRDKLKIGAAIVLTSPFLPLLFQGEEWASSSPFQYFVDFYDEPELAKAVSEGRRHEFEAFGWKPEDVPDPQDTATFDRSKLRWDETTAPDNADILDWYTRLIHLRRARPSLTTGRLDLIDVRSNEQEQWLLYEREAITVIANFARENRRITLRAGRPTEVLLSSKPPLDLSDEAMTMLPESVVILGS